MSVLPSYSIEMCWETESKFIHTASNAWYYHDLTFFYVLHAFFYFFLEFSPLSYIARKNEFILHVSAQSSNFSVSPVPGLSTEGPASTLSTLSILIQFYCLLPPDFGSFFFPFVFLVVPIGLT